MHPFNYSHKLSNEVFEKTSAFIKENSLDKEIGNLGWAYQAVGDLIPHTTESWWSGHFFPWVESFEELQISWNLCSSGFYKQAMSSLRSTCELGLLSVYWNLNDDGHIVVNDWVKAKEDTPRGSDIWKKLIKHQNFQYLQNAYDLKSRILALGELHNYVHTRGAKYSNKMGGRVSNFQTFEERAFNTWFYNFKEVVAVIAICHLTKYPVGTFSFDYSSKFGIDTPMFGGIVEHKVKILEELVGEEVFTIIKRLSLQDENAQEIIKWVTQLPDMTKEEVDEQIRNMDRLEIEMSGLGNWIKNQTVIMEMVTDKSSIEKRINDLSQWAKDKGFDKPPFERKKNC